jgi:hypothetical protein
VTFTLFYSDLGMTIGEIAADLKTPRKLPKNSPQKIREKNDAHNNKN